MPITPELRRKLDDAETSDDRRAIAWLASRKVSEEAERARCAGAILMGLKFETIIDEAALAWNQTAPE